MADSVCSVCSNHFAVTFSYQVHEHDDGRFSHYCSHACYERALSNRSNECVCSVCKADFKLEFPFQVQVNRDERWYFCSTKCRQHHAEELRQKATHTAASDDASPARGPRRIAVFNHKGGTGKTTTSVNLAAGLAERGARVLLIDADGQGNVGASLGINGAKNLYHVLVVGADPKDVVVPVRDNLDVITSNELLASAELYLASRPNRDSRLRERMGQCGSHYDVVVIDCAPALSLMNQNALVYADSVIIPVSCDYLSLVGVRQVMRTLKNVRELLRHPINLVGVLPTFYDIRNNISRESMDVLKQHFGERCLPPIRVNTKLKEAPSVKQTIFEYAAESYGAADYLHVVQHLEQLWQQESQPVSATVSQAATTTSTQRRMSA